jgi:hypothetical protein
MAVAVAAVAQGLAEDASARAESVPAERGPVAVFGAVASSHPLAVARVIVRGRGCLTAEDMLQLRLTRFDPWARDGRGVVAYRCMAPDAPRLQRGRCWHGDEAVNFEVDGRVWRVCVS